MTIRTDDIVRDALESLIVQAAEAPIVGNEASAAIRALNDMMYMWELQGIDIGYTQVSDMADPITVPMGAIMGIKANLALNLAPKYNVDPPPILLKNASDGFQAIVKLSTQIAPMEYPSTLPTGSGNYDNGAGDFYPDMEGTILTETGGSIALEDDTEG